MKNISSGRTAKSGEQADVSPPRSSVRTLLFWLTLACLLPAAIGTGVLFFHMYQGERAQFEKNAIQIARAMSLTVDVQLMNAQVAAQSLADSDELARQDFAGVHRRASALLEKTGVGSSFVLSDESGQQIVNTLRPFGEPLPRSASLAQLRQVFVTGQPAISDVFRGSVSGSPMISINVPVLSKGRVAYVLSVGIMPQQLNQILLNQRLPPDWVTGIFDRTGTLAARNHSPERFVGQKAPPEAIEQMMAAPEGAFEGISKEGNPSFVYYSRSPLSHWRVGIGVQRQSVKAELLSTLSHLGLGMALLFSASIGLAWLMGGRISRSVRALTAPAIALEAGQALVVSELHFREAQEVATAMAHTAQLLKQRTNAIHEAHETIREREAELNNAQHIAHLGNWFWDARTDTVLASEEVLHIFGRESLPPLAEQSGILYPPEAWQQLNAAIQKTLKTGIGCDLELPALRADGTPMWITKRSEAVRDASGAVIAVRGTVQDITARKLIETELEQHRNHLEQLVLSRTAELQKARDEAESANTPSHVFWPPPVMTCANLWQH